MAAIDFQGVTYRIAESAGESGGGGRLLLHDVNLSLESGTTTALLGRSGSGKTTLLRMVNRLLEPSSGRVLVEGQATTAVDAIALRRRIGYVIQETGLFRHMSVARNVAISLEIAGVSDTGKRASRVEDMLGLVGMDAREFAPRYPHQLSGGQRQRVGIARALAGEPEILLMDEPFGALDPLTRAEMQTMLHGLLRRLKKTVLLVTHDLDEALYLASRVVLIAEGRLAADLRADEVLTSKNPAVMEYVRAFHRGDREMQDANSGGEARA